MKTHQSFFSLPLGAIKAESYLKEQMLLGKDGIAGHLPELEPGMIADPWVNKTFVKAWAGGDQSGWGAEISGNYWSAYIKYAYVLDDEEMKQKATDWVNAVLKKQKDDGYLGTYYEDDAKIYEDYNAWGTNCGMKALLAYYGVSKRKDVLEAVHRCMLWFCDKWKGDNKTVYGGPTIMESMMETYRLTGDKRLVDFINDYLEYHANNDLYLNSYKSLLNIDNVYNTNHGAGQGIQLDAIASAYIATGREECLKGVEKRINVLRKKCNQLSGSITCTSEYLSPIGGNMETEYCAYRFFAFLYTHMLEITGDVKYGEYLEEMFYNGAQGARGKDEKTICYFNSPNQILATENSSPAFSDTQVYAPCYPTSCCPVNAVGTVPEFVMTAFMTDKEDNLYATTYCPCNLDYNGIKIKENTLYPFRNNILFEINCNKKFSFNLKIPKWAKSFKIKLNGERIKVKVKNGYACINRAWIDGDKIEINFDTEVKVIKVDDTDGSARYPLAVKYGALLYAYHIPECWYETPGRPMTPLPDGWHWYNVLPKYDEVKAKDPHEEWGVRRDNYAWNIAFDEKLSAKDFTVEEIEPNGYAWKNPYIKLHTHGYHTPYRFSPYQVRNVEQFEEYQFVTHKKDVTLEPYGCTNLRITYFPKANLKNRK